MCTHLTCPPGVCFIIPPHMLEHIATNATDPALRQRALQNLQQQGLMRGMRAGIGQFAFAGISPGTRRRTIYDAR